MTHEDHDLALSRRDLLIGVVGVGATTALAGRAIAAPKERAVAPPGRTLVGSDVGARSHHTVTRLDSAWALLAGGYLSRRPTANVLLIDTINGAHNVGAPLLTARARHAAITLSDGRVLVLGGHNGRFLSSVEAYDPMTGTWQALDNLAAPRADFSVVETAGGLLLLGGNGPYGPMRQGFYSVL